MWKKIELKPKEGWFLMKGGMYINPNNVPNEYRNEIIGYCIEDNKIMSINSSKNSIKWSTKFQKILGLYDYQYSDGSNVPYLDIDGECNTKCILDHCNWSYKVLSINYPSTYYCTSFSPGYRDGSWYLPSIGELKLFFDIREKFRKDCITAGLDVNIMSDTVGNCYFWSSTEYSRDTAWGLDFSFENPSTFIIKSEVAYIIPFLNL